MSSLLSKVHRVDTAWILDTDLGWDPDDVIALFIIVEHIKKNKNDKLALISSDETFSFNRAMVIKNIIDNIYPDNNILVVHGVLIKNKKYFSEGLLSYHSTGIGTIDNLCYFIEDNKNSRLIKWIGIGGMTNLCEIIVNRGIKIDEIYQMGGSFFNDIEYNINLDPYACQLILNNPDKYNNLTFIPLDTTGYKLNWLNEFKKSNTLKERMNVSFYHSFIHIDFYNFFSKKYPFIVKILKDNICCSESPTGYYGSSSLHDPLTVIFALTNGKLFETEKAFVDCDKYGVWKIKLSDECLNKYDKKTDIKFWWDSVYKYLYRIKDTEKFNCNISIGPLSDIEVYDFSNELKKYFT